MKVLKNAFDPHALDLSPGVLIMNESDKILSVQTQIINRYQKLSIWWAAFGKDEGVKTYMIHGAATGEQVPDEWAEHYIGTVQFGDGVYIMHIFAIPK